jgi:hypothetical protein
LSTLFVNYFITAIVSGFYLQVILSIHVEKPPPPGYNGGRKEFGGKK